MCHCFWIYFLAAILQWITWIFQYFNNPLPKTVSTGQNTYILNDFFAWEQIHHILGFAMIFIGMLIVEFFNYAALMYVNKKTRLSEVALYVTLHASYIIIFGIITNQYSGFMYAYIVMVYTGYIMIFWRKQADLNIGHAKN